MTTRVMIDSAWPLPHPRAADVTLVYMGGDTPHPWSPADIAAVTTPLLWPCWVRSNPGQVSAAADAANCMAWLAAHKVPKGTAVILDLETAVNAAYVTAFDAALVRAGYTVTKYGSQGFIWRNPKTSGGTFVAAPGVRQMITTGDCVATQFDFAGAYDLSWVLDTVPLWDVNGADMPLTDADVARIDALFARHLSKAEIVDAHGDTIGGVLARANTQLPAIQSVLDTVSKNTARQLDPAVFAAAVISQLAAGGFSAGDIAAHILAGLPADMAQQVVDALAAALAARPAPAVT
jgi:hypothetical protein